MAQIQRKIPEAWYSGSLIQQNHGESVENHGFLVWDQEKQTPEQVDLENPYGFYTIDVERAALPLDIDVPEKPRLRIRVRNTPQNEVRRISKDARSVYNPERLSVIHDSEDSELQEALCEAEQLRLVPHQTKLITEFVSRHFPIADSKMERLREIHKKIEARCEDAALVRNNHWKPLRFEFSNLFSYGENNVVDFENRADGLVGFFAENASGKSSLADALCFCLFDETSRGKRTEDILNRGSRSLECKLWFEIQQKPGTYVIHRKGSLNSKGKIPVSVDFYRIEEDGSETNLNGKYRYYTNQEIQNVVGTYEDFIHTAFSVQNQNSPFIQKSQSNRKDLLNRFLGIDVFEAFYSEAKSESSKIQTLINDIQDADVVREEIEQQDQKIQEIEEEIREVRSKKEEKEETEDRLLKRIMKLNKQHVSLPDIEAPEDADALQERYEAAKREFEECKRKHDKTEGKLEQLRSEVQEKEQEKEAAKNPKLKQQADEQKTIQQQIQSLKERLQNKRSWIQEKEKNEEHLLQHEFDPDCEFCVKRNERDAAKLGSLRESLATLRSERADLESELAQLEEEHEPQVLEAFERSERAFVRAKKSLKEARNMKGRVGDLERRLRQEKAQKRGDLDSLRSRFESFQEHQSQILKNQEINEETRQAEAKLSDVRSTLQSLEKKLLSGKSRIEVLKEKRKQSHETLQKTEKLSEDLQLYKWYVKAVRRDGIPTRILQQFVPKIEDRVNAILSQIAEFAVMVDLDDKDIHMRIVYGEEQIWSIEMGSGMEKFVSSLAIRSALAELSTVPKPQFLMVDEGFGNLDSDNIGNIYQIFDYLKSRFEFIFVISHIDLMRGVVDDTIEVRQNSNGKSQVRFE